MFSVSLQVLKALILCFSFPPRLRVDLISSFYPFQGYPFLQLITPKTKEYALNTGKGVNLGFVGGLGMWNEFAIVSFFFHFSNLLSLASHQNEVPILSSTKSLRTRLQLAPNWIHQWPNDFWENEWNIDSIDLRLLWKGAHRQRTRKNSERCYQSSGKTREEAIKFKHQIPAIRIAEVGIWNKKQRLWFVHQASGRKWNRFGKRFDYR